MQQSINTTMDTEEIQDSVDGDESAFYKPEKHRATISQETLSGNIYSPSGDHQHVVININNINNNNYYDVIHKAKRIAEQEKSNNDPIKSLEEDLAFEQQTRVSFNDRASTHQSNTIPTTEEAIAEWFYALDTYEQQYTFTTAILHGAPAHIISKHAEELYKGIKEHEIRFYTIPPTQTNAESLTALPKQHHSSIESLRKRTYTVMHQSQGIACIYWADTDAYGYSPFNSRILAFLSKEFTNKGSYGEFFLSKVKSWANNRDSDYDYWLAAKALGSILRITNVQQLQKQADEFAKQGSVIGHRRTASLLAGAYDSEQQEQLSEPHSSPVLTILDRWTKKVYQNPKAQSNILLGRTIAHSYSFIGREKPEIALQETAQLLKELPIEDLNCAASLSSACISTYVSLTWSGHLRKVLCNLAKIFEELLDQWSATDKLSQREYERQQREYCLRKTNNTFFLILAATIHLEGYTTPVETYTQQLPAERIQIAELNYNIFIAAILQNDPLKEAILKLFRSAIITAHSQAAMMFLRNWSETVINIYKQKQDQQTNDLYSTYIAFLSHIGQEIQQWEQKWRKHGHYPTSLSKVYQRHLMQWQKEGKRHNPYLEQMASAILQHISTQYSKSEVTA